MIPILYSADETAFQSNGIGRLADCVSCAVTEERNGIFECEFQYPVDGKYYDQLVEGGIIGIWHDDLHDVQPFDIYKCSAPLNGLVTFYAHHISYRLGNIILAPVVTASTVAELFQKIPTSTANPCPFEFWTDKVNSATWTLNKPDNVRAVLGGQTGSVLDTWGKGEYEFDKWTVKLYVNRGQNHGVTIRYGKNLVDVTNEVDSSGIFNAIAPFWVGVGDGDAETVVCLDETFVKPPDATGAAVPVVMDFSGEFQEMPTQEQLRQRALAYLSNNTPWNPSNNVKIDFVQLWQTPEYENVAALQRVRLCDRVSVYYPELGLVVEDAEVIKVVYNVLLERYDSMEIGNPRTTLADSIAHGVQGQIDTLAEILNGKVDESSMQDAIDSATSLITGGLGGYVLFGFNANGQPTEILIMDTPSTATAQNVIRINNAGIGFSTTGYQGPFTSAWTIDGAFVADFITSGTLNANVLRAGIISDQTSNNYWNLTTGEFRLASTTKVGSGDQTLADIAIKAETIMEVDVEYAQNQSSTTAPGTGWSTTAPAWRDGYFIWQRTKTVDGAGQPTYSDPTCIQGAAGERGASIWKITTAPSAYTTTQGGFTPSYRILKSTVLSQSGATEILVGDILEYSYYHYPVGYVANYVYLGPRTSIRGATGATGTSVTAIVEQYYLSTSNTTQTGGSWSTNQPAWSRGKYIWTRSQVTWSNGTTTYTDPVLAKAINGANEAVDDLDTGLDQQGVFNRLTNNGTAQGIYLENGRLYINATYIGGGTITDTQSNNFWNLLTGQFSTKMGVIGPFTLKSTGLYYGEGVANSAQASITYQGIMFKGSGVSSFCRLGQTGLEIYGPVNTVGDENLPALSIESTGGELQGQTLIPTAEIHYSPLATGLPFMRFYSPDSTSGQHVEFYQEVIFRGGYNVPVGASKNKVMPCDEFGERELYCYETTSPLFGDVGEGEIDADGICYVFLDPVFAETISTAKYQVFLQSYGAGDCYVDERASDYFVVRGKPGLRFGWELKAKQIDTSQNRMEKRGIIKSPDTENYGELAAEFIKEIEEGRIGL